jgi:hypothetical protein
MTDTARAERLIATLTRLDGIVVDLQRACAEAVTDIEALGRAAHRAGGKAGVDALLAAISVDSLYGSIRQRLLGVGLEQLLQRTTSAVSGEWVASVTSKLRRVVPDTVAPDPLTERKTRHD